MTKISPLAPDRFPDIPAVAGVRLATAACAIKSADRLDVLLAVFDPGTAAAGVYTDSSMSSVTVDWCREALEYGTAAALVVNSGNANAFTGDAGMAAVRSTTAAAAAALGCAEDAVFVSSTGVIGEPLPVEKITSALPGMAQSLSGDWQSAAEAIMTTDTYPKGATASAEIDGVEVTIAGIAKGSGMIAPNMATMLAYMYTDAAISPSALQTLLNQTVELSFNAITVDSDRSTNDTLMLFATGAAGHDVVDDPDDPRLAPFRMMLDDVARDLAHQIVRDGEGASKFVEISITGAESDAAAKTIGLTIANSPLVKTAIAGEDANWGRIVMAIGKSGEQVAREGTSVAIGGIEVAANGGVVSDYDEAPVAAHMKGQEIDIAVDVGVGRGTATVWTCDLTHDYISINADYRT